MMKAVDVCSHQSEGHRAIVSVHIYMCRFVNVRAIDGSVCHRHMKVMVTAGRK